MVFLFAVVLTMIGWHIGVGWEKLLFGLLLGLAIELIALSAKR